MHHPDHEGHHHHHQVDASQAANKAFVWGIALNGIYVGVQVVMGLYTHSIALLSDAGHNLGDVASLALSLIAFRLSRIKATQSFTYGYKKTTIIAALINAVVLLSTVIILGYESLHRMWHPRPIEGGTVAIVAGIGIVVNAVSALFFFSHKDHDLNTKSAYLHLLSDALVSVGVVISGIVISYTSWYWLDGAISIVVLLTILLGTWSLLTSSLRLSLDAVPASVNKEHIESELLKVAGVAGVHHMHIWAMSTTENALTAHVILDESLSFDEKMKVVHKLKHELQHLNIHHSTIELETAGMPCDDDDC